MRAIEMIDAAYRSAKSVNQKKSRRLKTQVTTEQESDQTIMVVEDDPGLLPHWNSTSKNRDIGR